MNPILLVDDMAEDRYLFERAHELSAVPNPLVAFDSGEDLQDHLTLVEAADAPAPCVVLVDLNMPRITGFDVLQWAAERPGLRHVPLVIFSSSDQQSDIDDAYRFGANGYVRKPLGFAELKELVQTLGRYWCDYNLSAPPTGG